MSSSAGTLSEFSYTYDAGSRITEYLARASRNHRG
jgi:hypothetical protein